MKKPDLRPQSMLRKTSATRKVNNMLTETAILCAADRISSGKISLGTNHPRGPHDHAKAAT